MWITQEVYELSIIAITVSTNYSDLIPYILKANTDFFKKWIFVTDAKDTKTINEIPKNNKFDILFSDFKRNGAVFNKGAAIRHAQETAHKEYPDDWYLLIDSDICLDESFNYIKDNLDSFNKDCIYGSNNRKNFTKLSDYMRDLNGKNYNCFVCEGFFQLYYKHLLYSDSNNASECDLSFAQNFTCKQVLDNVRCKHLGSNGVNWYGRKSSDFHIDV